MSGGAVVPAVALGGVEGVLVSLFASFIQSRTEVQLRHLRGFVLVWFLRWMCFGLTVFRPVLVLHRSFVNLFVALVIAVLRRSWMVASLVVASAVG
jgi:hypothetical protein